MPSEEKLKLKLADARTVNRVIDDAKRGVGQRRVRPVPDVPVEGVNQIKFELKVHSFIQGKVLDNAEVFLHPGRSPGDIDQAGHIAVFVGCAWRWPARWIGILEKRPIEIGVVGIPIRTDPSSEGIEAAVTRSRAQERLPGNLIEANTIVFAGNALRAAKT